MPGGSFTADIAAIRERARQKMEQGPVTFADEDLEGMLRDNLTAERIVITTYQEIIRWIGDGDPTTRRLLESVLADEEEHADDLVDLLGA
jgi:bacterioferritin